MIQFFNLFLSKGQKLFFQINAFFGYGSMQLNELISNITLVLHKNDVLLSKMGFQAKNLGF
jgi:hypothetical protein